MLTLNEIRFEYGDGPVLNGLDLSVSEGEIVGLVGPNGSAKTTALRLVSGAIRPSGGSILIDGTDLDRLGARERGRLVSVVPQDPQLPLSFTVNELVMMGRTPHLRLFQWEGRRDYEIAWTAMQRTAVAHLADRSLETLSGGERQRAVIAMALAQEAPLLLLDEPTSSLDLAHQIAVMELVRGLHRDREGAVLVAMHDLTLAARYCSRVVMLAEGSAYAEGAPGEVLTPDNISAVYGVEVVVMPHPTEGTPVVVPIGS